MTAAVEYFACPDIHGSVSLRTEGDTNPRFGSAGFGAFFAHEDGVEDVADLQRHVHQTLAIALLVVGVLIYKEALTATKVAGIAACLVGIFLLNK